MDAKGKPDAVFEKLRTYCDKKLVLKELGNLRPQVDWNEKKRQGEFNEKGVKGMISVTGQVHAKITLKLEIPFLMTPFKGLISSSIQKHLERFS